MKQLLKVIPLSKVDEGSHTAYGIATAEVPDKDNEICDYKDTAPHYIAWSEESFKATSGAGQEVSLGNIRLQHQLEIAGKVTKLDLKADAKEICIESKPVDDRIWGMLTGGFITGYSQAGSYLYRRCNVCRTDIEKNDNYCPKCRKEVTVRYACMPAEVSYVDNPALGVAHFSYVKANGASELRKFASKSEVPASAARKEVLMPVFLKAKAEKGMYQVAELARMLDDVKWLRDSCVYEGSIEDDETDIAMADDLKDWLIQGSEILAQLVENETSELTAKAADGEKGATMSELIKVGRASMKSHFSKAAVYHEKMSEHHDTMAESHKAMFEHHKDGATKAEAGSEAKDLHKAQMGFHKSAMTAHEKCGKAQKSQADHCARMEEAYVGDESAKAVEPEAAKAAPETAKAAETKTDAAVEKTEKKDGETATEKAAGDPVQAQFDVAVRKGVDDSLKRMLESAEGQKLIDNAVQQQVLATLGKTIEPTAVKMAGQQLVARAGETLPRAETPNVDDCGL